jgi:hypothetical protein
MSVAEETSFKSAVEAKLKLLAQVASLEARPDLTRLESLVAEATEARACSSDWKRRSRSSWGANDSRGCRDLDG